MTLSQQIFGTKKKISKDIFKAKPVERPIGLRDQISGAIQRAETRPVFAPKPPTITPPITSRIPTTRTRPERAQGLPATTDLQKAQERQQQELIRTQSQQAIKTIEDRALTRPVREVEKDSPFGGKIKVARTLEEYQSGLKSGVPKFRPPQQGEPEYEDYVQSVNLRGGTDQAFGLGFIKQLGSGVGGLLESAFDKEKGSPLFEGVRSLEEQERVAQTVELGKFKAGEITGALARNLGAYTGASSIVEKLGLEGAKSLAGKQGVALLVDTIAQAPFEAYEFVTNDKSAGKDVVQFVKNRAIDVAFNLVFQGIEEGVKSLKNIYKTGDDQTRALIESQAQSLSPQQQLDVLGAEFKGLTEPRKLSAELFQDIPVRQTIEDTRPVAETIAQPQKLSDQLFDTRTIAESTGLEPIQTTIRGEVPQGGPIPTGQTLERGFARNVRTDEAMEQQIRDSFQQATDTYDVLNNRTTLESAQQRFAQGYEQALKDFDLTKNQFRADNVPLARLIANEAARIGDMSTARRVISEMAETLTTAGQFSQAGRILRESNDPSTVLQFVQKELNRLNDVGSRRFGKKWKPVDLTDEQLSVINRITKESTDEQKQEVFEQLFRDISDQIPVTGREKFDAWRRISMLFNPKTHVRNVLGNTIMGGIKQVADTVGAGLETMLVPQAKRTKALFPSKELKQTAEQYWNANKQQLQEGSRWDIFGVQSPFADKRIFDSDLLEGLNNLSKKTLEGEDIFFLKRHFQNDLAKFMKARGITEPTQEAVNYALRRAQEATFREANALSDAISKMKGSKFGLIVEAAIPFSKTPANILKTGVDYSPVGLTKSIFQLASKAEPEVFVETLSKGLTGTGLAMAGYFMAKNGLARGDYKRGGEEQALQLAGELPNSIKLPNGSYTVDWAQPSSMPFFMGVAFAEALEKENPDIVDASYQAMINGGESLVNASMLRGIKDMFGGQYGSTTEKLVELPFNYLSQAVPTISGQIARSVDPTKRQRDFSSLLPKLQTQTQAKIPFASLELPAKRGLLGEELTYGEGLTNVLQQFLSPGYLGTESTNPVAKEIVRLYNEIGTDFIPRSNVKNITFKGTRYNFTPQEISEFQREMGEFTEDKVRNVLNNPQYIELSDEEKSKIIKQINDQGYDYAKQQYLIRKGVL